MGHQIAEHLKHLIRVYVFFRISVFLIAAVTIWCVVGVVFFFFFLQAFAPPLENVTCEKKALVLKNRPFKLQRLAPRGSNRNTRHVCTIRFD